MAVLAGSVWLIRDSGPVRQALQFVRQTAASLQVPALRPTGAATDPKPAGHNPATAARSTGGLRKCFGSGTVLYTDGDCPVGSKPQPVTGGTLTVMPAQPVPATAPSPDAPASRASTIRDLVMKPGEKTIQEMAIDRAMDKIK